MNTKRPTTGEGRVWLHVERFIAEEFTFDPKGRTTLSIFCRAYNLWCSANMIVNRKLPPLILIEEVERRLNIKARLVPTEGRTPHYSIYAMPGLRLKRRTTEEFLRRRRPGSSAAVPEPWAPSRGDGDED